METWWFVLALACISHNVISFRPARLQTIQRVNIVIRAKINPLSHANGVQVGAERNEDQDLVMDNDVSKFAKLDDEERLQKVIARAGVASRRDAEKMVRKLHLN
jgi:formylmethanofuran dehydrogenase subunit C